MGTWTAAEGATAWVLAWVPFYQEAKLAVVLWMVAPQSEVRPRFRFSACVPS